MLAVEAMLALVGCCILLATVAHVVLLRWRRFDPGAAATAVRWARAPYRSFQPIESVVLPNGDPGVIVQIGAWSSLVSGFVLIPGLGWALATLPLGSFAPVIAMWLGLAMAHLWCARTLLRGARGSLASVRTVALATMAIATPLSLTCVLHLANLDAADHDPCIPDLRTRLAASLLCIAHALVLLVATRSAGSDPVGTRTTPG